MTSFSVLSDSSKLKKNNQLLDVIAQTLTEFITETNPYIIFNGLLNNILMLTDSEYGFMGEIFYDQDEQPHIQNYGMTNMTRNKQAQRLHEVFLRQGQKNCKIERLYGEVLKTGSCVISVGHLGMDNFLGLPIYSHGSLLGVACIVNREHGYDQAVVAYLQPFIEVCGSLIQTYRSNQRQRKIEQELVIHREYLSMFHKLQQGNIDDSLNKGIDEANVFLGSGYLYRQKTRTLLRNNCVVLLTPKEVLLLHLLVSRLNEVVNHQTIESFVWGKVIVSESSLRSLVLRLRKKLSDLHIKTVSGVGHMLIN